MALLLFPASFLLLLLPLSTTTLLASSSLSSDLPSINNITVYNYLSIQGPNSSSHYNTALCGLPPSPQPNSFAQTYCFHMPLLAGPNLTSTLVGQVQGTFVFVALTGAATSLFVSETFSLNTTSLQGTFTGVGLEQIGTVSSKPITGGTGDFAFQVGVAYTTPLSNGTDANGNFFAWFKYEFTFQ